MLLALEKLPHNEYQARVSGCLALLNEYIPEASGLLVCSRVNIYYLTGTLCAGVLWIPKDKGEPVLLVRKAYERAVVESPVPHIHSFTSYKEISQLCFDAGSPLGTNIAIEKKALSWDMAVRIQERIPNTTWSSCDQILQKIRVVKSEWERKKMRICGDRHKAVLERKIIEDITADMTELEIAHIVWSAFFKEGHQGQIRCSAPGEELFLGYVSAGESSNYPAYFNGALTGKGVHPAIPFMGDAGTVWKHNMLLAIDAVFVLEGYHTDKTQIYWSGTKASLPDKVRKAQELCAEIYDAATTMLKPGNTPEDIWMAAQKYTQKIDAAGIFMGKEPVPFLGHGIGLTIDEAPIFAKGFTEPLQEGMVVAIEPKISVPNFGTVGIENTLEITETGVQSLTGNQLDIITLE